MSDFIKDWFGWFEQGTACLKQEEKEKLFRKCGQNCADSGIIEVYKKIYRDSKNDLDVYFTRLNELDSVGGNVLQPGKEYEVIFTECLCDLHTMGYVNSDFICECSRQSILYVMNTLEPKIDFEVQKITSVLSGDHECRFHIRINGDVE